MRRVTTTKDQEGIEIRIPLPELLEALADPAVYGVDGPVEVVQTHISAVFLAGDRAYKVKKPLRLWGFLDYGTVARRRHCCEREVALNRRTAPGIYLGVEPIVRRSDGRLGIGGDGEVVEHAVVMVRLPEGATFLERLEAGTLREGDVREAASRLAAFHRANVLTVVTGRLALPSCFGRVVRQNFRSTREGVPDPFPARLHERIAARLARRMFDTRSLVRRRLAAGRMVDGHGDVRLEHVVRYEGQVDVIDCVEFSDLVRHNDQLCDLAFLSMDLAAHGRWDLANVLEDAYLDAAGEDREEAALLMPLYLAYRAHVRAKVDRQTANAPEVPPDVRAAKRRRACRALALSWTYARVGEVPPLILLRGPSGVGKSVLATAIAPWLGAEIVRSDLVRKELAGLAPTDRVDAEGARRLYAADMSARTYDEVMERGATALRAGRAALLDATWLRLDSRTAARDLARRLGAPFAILDITCPDEIVRERIRSRAAAGTDPSDATVAVYEEQIRTDDPLDAEERAVAVTVDSRDPVEPAVLQLLDRIEQAARRR